MYLIFERVLCRIWEGELDEMPDSIDDVYQKAVAGQLLMEQQNTLTKLQQSGVFVANPSPENLSVATVNRYLELKGRKLI